jgi:hypothetical protein
MKRVLFAAAALAVYRRQRARRSAADKIRRRLVLRRAYRRPFGILSPRSLRESRNVDDWLAINPDSFGVHEMHCQVLVARASKRGDCSDVWEMRVQGRPIHNGALSVRLVRRNCLS